MSDLKRRLKSKIEDMEVRLLFSKETGERLFIVNTAYQESAVELLKECYEVICQMEAKEDDLK